MRLLIVASLSLIGSAITGCTSTSTVLVAEEKHIVQMPIKPLVQHLVFFDWDKHDLPENISTIITPHVLHLLKNPTQRVLIEGSADETGDSEYNQNLGFKRAKVVESVLIAEGVSPNQIIVRSIGIERPLNLEGTKASLPRNRRVTLVY